MKVIFLDIDGVLNSYEFFEKIHEGILSRSNDLDDDLDSDAVNLLFNYVLSFVI